MALETDFATVLLDVLGDGVRRSALDDGDQSASDDNTIGTSIRHKVEVGPRGDTEANGERHIGVVSDARN